MRIVTMLSALARDPKGATAIEYGLLTALLAVAALGAITSFANQGVSMWNSISTKSHDAIQQSVNN